MSEPEKPFACSLAGCGQTFTNEDHLHVHKKKHDMMLQFGLEQKSAFVADQTPTPTRFIRNCEEVGLFQDLQNVNPFDEGFKRAMDSKTGVHTLEAIAADDTLHTPQMFPIIDGDSALYTTTNNQRNITISRSSSDESGAVKEYETTTISKLTNEVTRISRIVEKQEPTDKSEESGKENKDVVKENSVSYRNNVIKIQSNLEIRKDTTDLTKNTPVPIALVFTDSIVKDEMSILKKDVLLAAEKLPPIMSQKSLDLVIDRLNDFSSSKKAADSNATSIAKGKTSDGKIVSKQKNSKSKDLTTDCEVTVTINGKKVRMKPVDEIDDKKDKTDAKQKIKRIIASKIKKVNDAIAVDDKVGDKKFSVSSILPINGTLIPINFMNKPIILTNAIPKLPIPVLNSNMDFKVPRKRSLMKEPSEVKREVNSEDCKGVKRREDNPDVLEMRSAASKRYREKLKDKMTHQSFENIKLKEINKKLLSENVALKKMVMEHLKTCPDAGVLEASFATQNPKQ